MKRQLLAAGLLAGGFVFQPIAQVGVPYYNPPYGADVEVYWANHPFNPESPAYHPAIPSPEKMVELSSGQSIQNAIDAMDARGGTIMLSPGTYASFRIVGKNNIHILAKTAATVKGSRGRIIPCDTADDYGKFHSCLFYGNPACVACAANQARNYYFRNITFDAGGGEGCMSISAVRDIVFDNCEFINVARAPWHNGCVNGNSGLNNVWFRNCHFTGAGANNVVYLDGLHGGGFIGCTFDGDFSNGILWLCNDDFSFDYNRNGIAEPWEYRDSRYNVVYGCTSRGNADGLVSSTGDHILVTKNKVTNGINYLWRQHSKATHMSTTIRYEYVSNKAIANTVERCVLGFMQVWRYDYSNEGGLPKGVDFTVGRYDVRGNVIGSVPLMVTEDGRSLEGPNIVCGNCIGSQTCTPDAACGARSPESAHALVTYPQTYTMPADNTTRQTITAKVCDVNGALVTGGSYQVQFTLSGDAELIGANPAATRSGVATIQVRAKNISGHAFGICALAQNLRPGGSQIFLTDPSITGVTPLSAGDGIEGKTLPSIIVKKQVTGDFRIDAGNGRVSRIMIRDLQGHVVYQGSTSVAKAMKPGMYFVTFNDHLSGTCVALFRF